MGNRFATRIWRQYREHFESFRITTGEDIRLMGRSSFHAIWNRYCPFVLTSRPRTDLCWTCQRNNRIIYQGTNITTVEKEERLAKQLQHLRVVKQERELYQKLCTEAKSAVDDTVKLRLNPPSSRPGRMHYSFDYAQQVHYPNDPDQPGPMYFMVPRKCGIFGINCEGVTQQVNFLIDEGMSSSKGSNAVISYVHFFFKDYGLGEVAADLHCDNCSGQNKNRFVLWYLAWRVIHKLHHQLTINFLIAGHTKFSPDWCFGLLKQRYRRCHISDLNDIAAAVLSSTTTKLNIPQLVGKENGDSLVNLYNWQIFLSPYFRPLPGIKSLHHMRFDTDYPGVIFYREYEDSDESSFQLLKNPEQLPPLALPEVISPPGLSEARQQYLYTNIRQFCAQDERADRTCPNPELIVNN